MPVFDPNSLDNWLRRISGAQDKKVSEKAGKGLTGPRKALLIIVLVLIVFFAILFPFSHFYTDVLWYNQTGFQQLFWKMFFAKILMVVVFGLFFFAVLYLNIYLAREIPPPQRFELRGSPLEPVIGRISGVSSKIKSAVLLIFSIIAAFF
ncbi:MAG: UPF0182 family protein, partial [Actinomycetota bacterium]|nr:UPF0182 family protein [Actinomycetota bacterium]